MKYDSTNKNDNYCKLKQERLEEDEMNENPLISFYLKGFDDADGESEQQ